MNVYQQLALVQKELKAPKNQYNSFGKYNYRSCEDILTAAKPLCIEYGLVLTISDEIKQVGDRYYVESRATVILLENGEKHTVCASARESQDKKGMDDSQITGAASSYARKYALNGLFAIDDSKDADTDEHVTETQSKSSKGKTGTTPKAEDAKLDANQLANILALIQEKGKDRAWFETHSKTNVNNIKASSYNKAIEWINNNA